MHTYIHIYLFVYLSICLFICPSCIGTYVYIYVRMTISCRHRNPDSAPRRTYFKMACGATTSPPSGTSRSGYFKLRALGVRNRPVQGTCVFTDTAVCTNWGSFCGVCIRAPDFWKLPFEPVSVKMFSWGKETSAG